VKSIPVIVAGVEYTSIRAAALDTGVSHRTLTARLNPARERALQKGWHQRNREKSRALRRKLSGKPSPTHDHLGACEICGDVFKKTPHLDHDHATGKFRGWLCAKCNTGLGLFRDDCDLLACAISYLVQRG
jgi:hypothetical protein